MNTYILPFTTDVEIKAFQLVAFPLGIIKANLSNYDLWLCDKFINCLFDISGQTLFYSGGDIWSASDGLTSKQDMIYTSDMLNQKDFSLIEHHKEQLLNNKYIIGFYDESQIPGKAAYGSNTYYHDYILFGFDNEKGIFKSAGYLKNGKYEYFDIKYEDYYNATVRNTIEPGRCGIDTYVGYCSINHNHVSGINVENVKEELINYLCSRNDAQNSDTGCCYGLAAWEAYSQYILSKNAETMDIRFSSFYLEHKTIMYKRIKTLYDQKLIKNNDLTEAYFKDICSATQTVHHLDLKYRMTNNPDIRKRMAQIVLDTTKKEKYYMERLLSELT